MTQDSPGEPWALASSTFTISLQKWEHVLAADAVSRSNCELPEGPTLPSNRDVSREHAKLSEKASLHMRQPI